MPEPENTPTPEPTRDGRVPAAVKWTVLGGIIVAVIAAVGPPLAERLRPDPKPTSTASAPQSAAAPATPPSPSPVAYTLTSAAAVPQCADLTGQGTKPAGREVGLFIKHVGDTKYFWEKLLQFDGDSWRVDKVMIGAPGDAGKEFELFFVPMSVQAVVEFSKHDGAPYAVDNPPLTPLATIPVTRTTNTTPC
ncbi:hypothetical protein Cme02nite_45410 [Catellatospora methionotrophica]|uniref:Uncharacterized protein n=1 Tax=Catellatospora methionotrophica TaxID=121620 RepID=A0A8J3LIH6_9ACTN|nr:hypothetical protein [Catellatospora methionotrophica]GIG16209.1 hypothetical protein Cme02nite_45410 [Catellatospora methionotrophica]